MGVEIVRRTAVGDTQDAIVAAVRDALERTGAVITTGGLGPTTDDVSRDAVAAVFGVALEVDDAHLQWMRERWRNRFNRDLPESNRRQAMIPAGARKLDNRHGSAPGVLIEDGRGWVIMLPGVPREMRGMTEDALFPLLREKGYGGDASITSLTLRTTGIAESLLQDQLTPIGPTLSAASLAYLPGIEGVDLRLTIRGRNASDAAELLHTLAGAIRGVIGEHVYGESEDDLAAVVLERCRARKLSIAVAESCTGGLLGARITAIPGSSDVFLGGVIAYANEVKMRDLGVTQRSLEEHGAVSEEVVREMAVGARDRFGADLGLAITGVAGPGGGTPEKPVGLVWVCAALGDRVEPRKLQSWGDRQEIRFRAAQAAMELARRMVP
jgi:nicotinamide-nucleotide amidase